MKKSIFLFFAAILCSVSAWAYNLPANYYIYFEKPTSWTQACLLIGKSSYSEGRQMTKISNTNLYCWTTVKWDGYTEYFFMQDKWGGENSSPTHRNQYAGSNKTAVFKTEFKKYHLFTTAGSKLTSTSSYTVVNKTQTIKVQLKDGSNWVDATVVPADLTASTYALTSATGAGAQSASLAKESTTVSATVSAAYSATVSLSCTNVLDGYMFEGWYNANGDKITSYTVSDAHTVYARFIQSAEETNEVTVTYMCGTTSVAATVAEFVGVETEKSFTAPTVTGYKFTNWTIGAGIDLKAGTASDATITVVTKSASSGYTLVANYEEVMETVYFINTGKWSVVNLHRWGGTATGTNWPGEAMTKTGEKIGEYDVYSFTAQQGAFANVIFTNKNTGSEQTDDLTWTAGEYYIYNYGGKTGWYTKAEAEELLVVPVVTYDIVVKAVAPDVWDSGTISIHYWGDGISATSKPVATEKDGNWNKYTIKNVPEGTSVNVIFVNGADWSSNANQTANITGITEDKCFQISAKNKDGEGKCTTTVVDCNATIEPEGSNSLTFNVIVPPGTEACYICGEWDWSSFKEMTKVDATHYTLKVAGAEKTHKYKYACQASWDYVEKKADGSELDSDRTWTENDVVEKWGFPTYTVAGDSEAAFGTTWDPSNTANDMTLESGLYKWTKTNVALYKNTVIKFQVVKNHDWSQGQWPGSGNDWELKDGITADGLYTITITFKEADKTINATATKTGDIVTKDFSNQPATLYFHPSFHWTSDAAQFAAYFYNNGPGADAEPTWANMTDGDGDGIYEVTNAKQHEYVIICRMNPDRTENKWDDEVMWNQIEHGITIPNTAGDLNTCIAFWTNCQGDVPNSECTWVAPTPLTDKNWSAFVAAYNGKTINAVVERSFKSGQYHTLCLPFDIPTNWLGEGTKAYQLTSIVANNTGDKLSLNATLWNTIVAGQPYIIVPVKGSEYEHVIINNVTVKNASAGTNVASGDGYKATLKAVTATDGTETNGSTEYYVGANDGKLYNAVVDKLGLRAIIELTTTGGQPLPPKVRAFVAAGENVETGVDNIVTTDAPVKVIENGQLIIIREGVKYNVQGQKL